LTIGDAQGTVIRSSTAVPSLIENEKATLRWTLTGSEWGALVGDGSGALSIAVTNTLRAAAWSDENGILPPPAWATGRYPIHSSGALPVELREPLSALSAWLDGIPASGERNRALFTAPALSALAGEATPASRLIVSAGFQALPFAEPATGLINARNRWYDPSTGTFLSPDPMGYVDSSNLYAFAGGDPINRRDPMGLEDDAQSLKALEATMGDRNVISAFRGVWEALERRRQRISAEKDKREAAIAEVMGPLKYSDDELQQLKNYIDWRVAGMDRAGEILDDSHAPKELRAAAKTVRNQFAFDVLLVALGGELRFGRGRGASRAHTVKTEPTPVVTPKPPGRPTWRTSEVGASEELADFGFAEQRSFLNGKEVPYGTPGSVRPDLTSDTLLITADVKNYNLSTPQGRYSLVQNVIDQAAVRATHLPSGYRQGLMIDVRGQTVKPRLLDAMADRIVKKTGGTVRRENIYFLGID
jgi:RHS repeat-associated protein